MISEHHNLIFRLENEHLPSVQPYNIVQKNVALSLLAFNFFSLSLSCPVNFYPPYIFFLVSLIVAILAFSASLFHSLTVNQGKRGRWQGLSVNWQDISEIDLSDHLSATANRAKTQKPHLSIEPPLFNCRNLAFFILFVLSLSLCLKLKVPPGVIFSLLVCLPPYLYSRFLVNVMHHLCCQLVRPQLCLNTCRSSVTHHITLGSDEF